MSAVLEEVCEADLMHVTLVRTSAGTCLRGRLKKCARTVSVKLLNTDSCLSQIQDALTHGGVCSERVLHPVGVYRSRFLTGLLWEWMPEGSLHSLLYETVLYPDLPTVFRLHILLDVAEGLNILHSVSLPHGALKTTNVLLDHQYHTKLCDWGQQTHEGHLRSRVSDRSGPCFKDLAFMAPEVLLGNAASVKSDIYSFGVLMWETLNRRPPSEGFDQLQNLVIYSQEGVEPHTEINLLPPETPQSQAFSQLMTRCLSVDPNQRPLAEECVLELRKVLETVESGAHRSAVHLIKTFKERALLSCKHTPAWELPMELSNLEGCGGFAGQKHLTSKSIPVTVSYSRTHNAQSRKSDETILRESPPFPTATRASTPMTYCRDASHTPGTLCSSNSDARHCEGVWGVKPSRVPSAPNPGCVSVTSPTRTHLKPTSPTVCPMSSSQTCCQLLQERRESIVRFMTEGRLNNLLDVLRARRAVTREHYEFITAAMTLSARTRCLLDTCACLGETVATLVATTLGLVSMENTN